MSSKNVQGFANGLESLEQRRLLSADIFGTTLRVEGTDGDDVIVIEAGESDGQVILTGVDGVDDGTLFEGIDRIGVKLGDGDDSATITGAMRSIDGSFMEIRIAGNLGDDQLFGGDSIDTLIGGGGNDRLEGGLHDDILRGGADNDDLFGGDGDDFIHGGKNRDNVRGLGGNDQLVGGRGFDNVNGGGGSDDVNGGWGNDEIIGGAGNDAIHGDRGDDIVRGGSGADEIHGDGGADEVLGGGGKDWLFGGEGIDIITGGDGSDTILAPADEVQDASDDDAKWTDSEGNELDFGSFSDDFWTALGTVSDALRSGNVDRVETKLDELADALDERADAFFDLLGEIVDDAPVKQDTFVEFEEKVNEVADVDVDQFFDDLADEVVDDTTDTDGDTGDGTGDDGTTGDEIDLSFLEGDHIPPSFLEAIDILKDEVGGELPEDFWEAARRLVDNHERFLERLDNLTATLEPEQLDGMKDELDAFMDGLFDDGFDPRFDIDAFTAEVGERIVDAFSDLTGEQRDAVLNVILAGARRDSAALRLEDFARDMVGGELPPAFVEAWERAGDEANGVVDGQFPAEYGRAIEILMDLVDGEIPGSFWDRFDAFVSSIHRAGEAFGQVLDSLGDDGELAPWVGELAHALMDAGYEPGVNIGALMSAIDQEIAGRFDGVGDDFYIALGNLLDSEFRVHELEEAVFQTVIDLLGGVLPDAFIEAWDNAEGDVSDEFDFLYQPHVPPSFIEAVEILKGEIDGDLPEDFWDLAERLLDNQVRFMDRLDEFTSMLTPDQLDGMKDRVDEFMNALFDDGFDPRVDGDAFEAELVARLPGAFEDLNQDQVGALSSVLRAGARRDSAAQDLESFALDLAGGELPQSFWDAWERAGDEANGLVHGDFPPQFERVFEVLESELGEGEIPPEFWDRFDAVMIAMGDVGFAFEQFMAVADDSTGALLERVWDISDAVLDAGYEPGADFESFLSNIDQDLSALVDLLSGDAFEALVALVDAEFAADVFEGAVFEFVGEVFGGVVPQDFFDAWEAAIDQGDHDDHGGHGGVDDLVGLDGVMPAEFFEAIQVAENAIGSVMPDDFYRDVEFLVQSVEQFAFKFGDVMSTLEPFDQDLLAFPILEISDKLHEFGYEGGDGVEAFLDQLDPHFRALVDGVSDETRGAMFVMFDEGAKRASLADGIEQKLIDSANTAGVVLPDLFHELWEMTGDLVLGS